MKRRLAGLAGIALALGAALPAAANTQDRFVIDDVVERDYSCAVHETTLIHGVGTAQLDGDGNFLFVSIQFTYRGTFTDPATGRTITQTGRQHFSDDGSTMNLVGQGTFLRMKGEGVVLHDVGRLVANLADGTTISATPKVLRIDDADVPARIDAAICGMFD
ncbi:MAG TPA: hypothetical protein VFV72_08245 [Candidatus Limnocylindrales bacterium]|nr:hypothetical protein [Candidatus Limnocylindrales bacterium]